MDVQITVPHETDMAVVEAEYPDMYLDWEDDDGDEYAVGNSSQDYDDHERDEEWLTRDEAVQCCGFVEGAIPAASTLIEGNGAWAQGMLSRRDFTGYNASPEELAERKRRSDLWWAAHARGMAAVTEKQA